MGAYIDPPNSSKEQFLAEYGIPVIPAPLEHFDSAGNPQGEYRLVCLLDNLMFTAAGIAYNRKEYEAFARYDGRAKKWFIVKRTDLTPEVASTLSVYERS